MTHKQASKWYARLHGDLIRAQITLDQMDIIDALKHYAKCTRKKKK